VFSEHLDPACAPLIELAAASLAAPSAARADEIDETLVGALVTFLRSGDGLLLAELMTAAPSYPLARHLWRRLIDAWREASRPADGGGVAATLFAVPTVIIVGAVSASEPAPVEGVLGEPERMAEVLREHGALAGNQTFSLSAAVTAADALDVPRLPALLERQRRVLRGGGAALDVPPAPIAVQLGQENVYLRFLVGCALAAPGIDLLAAADTARWGLPMARELVRQLGVPGVSLLALPGALQSPPAALLKGREAQRAVGAQLFASNAIRRLRASVGEPSAVISAHACPGAPGGGELRLSLSSVLDQREAEGFRCPLFPTDAVGDVVAMLDELLRDCRVTDIHILPGVHADRDPATGLTLLFKRDALPQRESPRLH